MAQFPRTWLEKAQILRLETIEALRGQIGYCDARRLTILLRVIHDVITEEQVIGDPDAADASDQGPSSPPKVGSSGPGVPGQAPKN